MKARYVVSIRRTTGLGDRLISLSAAWRFARNTGRTLVADWRLSHYATNAESNLFGLCFQASAELAGVPFIGDDTVAKLRLPGAPRPTIREAVYYRLTGCRRLARDDADVMIRAGEDVSARTVVLDSCINDGSAPLDEMRSYLGALCPLDHIADTVSAFRRQLGSGLVIGLHIRHGNGGDVMDHARYWDSSRAAIDRCMRAVTNATAQLGTAATLLLCTDSIEVERAVRDVIPDVVCRPKLYRPPNDGELHGWHGAPLVREDAMVEMLLLAECEVLIRYPPRSFFSFYAAVKHRREGQSRGTVHDLQRPFDPQDPLSPALLF
jgi:hypothetical protein